MVATFALALPLALSGVLIASAVGKIRNPEDLAAWTSLGVPRLFRRRWIVRLHPWAELVLAAALLALGGPFGLLAASATALLMVSYLILIVRAFRSTPDASCACFGETRPITRVTIARNAWLTALALASTTVISAGPTTGGAILIAIAHWDWTVALLVSAVTTGLILWRNSSVDTTQSQLATTEEDYVRMRTPAVPVTLGDGATIDLRSLAARRPQLLLAVSETCSACQPVIDGIDAWRKLVPEVDVRFLVTVPPSSSAIVSAQQPQTVHDPHGYVRASISEWPTPTAVLLGVDGMLAGGPVSKYPAIAAFVEEIRSSLDEITTDNG